MKVEFTNEELYLLSQGVIELIRKATEVKSFIYDKKTEEVIDSYQEKLTNLNTKVCSAITTDITE